MMNTSFFAELTETAERAARAGADVLRLWQGRIAVREKSPADLVTQADLASQQAIRQTIHQQFPDHNFVGEEYEEGIATTSSPARWIVDPLDGTTNYVHGLPFYSVSVAVEYEGKVVAGIVYDPERDECFRATYGAGATLNGRPIRTSNVVAIDQALLVTGFAPRAAADSPDVGRFIRMLHTAQGLRRLGSAALNLCYVACGRVDAYWASAINAWDVAAGALIAAEAGAAISGVDGKPRDLWDRQILTSSTSDLHRALIEAFREP